jgi:hypothetical protein
MIDGIAMNSRVGGRYFAIGCDQKLNQKANQETQPKKSSTKKLNQNFFHAAVDLTSEAAELNCRFER